MRFFVRLTPPLPVPRPAQARFHRKIGGLHWEAGDRARARAGFETGLALLAGQPEDVELARLYQEMGRAAFRSGDNAGAIEWAERALAHAERLAASGDPAPQPPSACSPPPRRALPFLRGTGAPHPLLRGARLRGGEALREPRRHSGKHTMLLCQGQNELKKFRVTDYRRPCSVDL